MLRTIFSVAFLLTSATSYLNLPLDALEIDIVFPRANATYDYTDTLPIIFGIQGISDAMLLGEFKFSWYIVPYGNVGGELEPGAVSTDFWSGQLSDDYYAGVSRYVLVNVTNPQTWAFPPQYPRGSVYALEWVAQWGNETLDSCYDQGVFLEGRMFFTLNDGGPEPDLRDMPKCPQIVAAVWLNTTGVELTTIICNNETAAVSATPLADKDEDPCAFEVDDNAVSSMSRVVQSLNTRTILPTVVVPTTPPSTSTSKSAAVATAVSLQPLHAAIFVLGYAWLA